MSNTFEPSPYEQDSMRKKKRMSGCMKVLLILGIIGGVLFLLAVAAVVAIFFWFKGLVSEDPAVITRVTAEIAQIDIPDELEPTVSMDMKVPFVGTQVMVMVMHADKQTGSMLMLIAMGEAMVDQDQQQARQSIEQQLQAQKVEGQETIKVEETREMELTINGQPATFTISKGVGTKSNTPRIQATGLFEGKAGPVMLMFDGQAETFTDQRVVAMLESIERKEPPVDEEPPADDQEQP